MPYPFVLPTTSAFAFTAVFACPTHPSLLPTASTYRGVVRDTLKRHKRLPPEAQAANLGLVVSSLLNYLPYLFAVADGLAGRNSTVRVVRLGPLGGSNAAAAAVGRDASRQGDDGPDTNPKEKKGNRPDKSSTSGPPASLEWRPVLADARLLQGKEPPRVRLALPSAAVLDWEVAFVLAALGHAYTLQARAALQPLYVVTSVVPIGSQQRLAAITASTKHLLAAAGVFSLAVSVAERSSAASGAAPSPEIAPLALRALSALALAEATLLAVLKDDPYPAVVAQDRNEYDREWMYKAPDIPKVRAHLFARLCLAAAEHAARAAVGASGLSSIFVRYMHDLQHTSRAKACRFFAIDADLGGQTGTALAWVHAALAELAGEAGTLADGGGSGSGGGGSSGDVARKHGLLGRFRKERSEKREDRRVERGLGWGADAGRLEETRVLEMLDAKWTKQNDTVNVQRVPPAGPLLAQMPLGREIHVLKPMDVPTLDPSVLEAMRAPPDPLDMLVAEDGEAAMSSSDEDESLRPTPTLVGSYPGTPSSYY